MTDLSARSRKAWETRKRMQIANGYGPKGRKRGTERHKVKQVSEILSRLRVKPDHDSGNPPPPPLDCRISDAGGNTEWKTPVAAREPETTG